MRRRGILIVGVVILVVAAVMWLGGIPEEPSREQSSGTAQKEASATRSRAPDLAALRKKIEDNARSAERAPTERPNEESTDASVLEGASLVDQLIAIRAIGSQADASHYLESNAVTAAKHVDRYCEEANRLRAKSPLKDRERTRDAAAFLAPRIDWKTEPPRHGTLHLPDAITAKIKNAEGQWPTAITEADLAGLNFDWMRELHNYDHWDLLTAGPVLEAGAGGDLDKALPYYVPLIAWAKLRFVAGIRRNDFAAAANDVRQLAQLIHTNGIVISELIALTMFKLEHEVGEPSDPNALAEVERLKKLTRYSMSFFHPGVDPEVMKRAKECVPLPCAAMFEGVWMASSMGDYSSRDTSDALWKMIDASDCDRSMLEQFAREPISAEEARGYLEEARGFEKLFD